MANTYEWTRIKAYVDDVGELTDVVVSMICGMTGTDGETIKYTDQKVQLPEADPDDFVQYADLTPEWMEAVADQVAEDRGFKEIIDRKIEAEKAKPKSKLWPWEPDPDMEPEPEPDDE